MARKIWNHFEEYLLVTGLAFSVVLIFFQIIMRYVFKNSLAWSEELARYVFLWLIWVGASFAVKEERHLRIEAFANIFTGNRRKIFELVVLIIWFGFSLVLAYLGYNLTSRIMTSGQVSPAMRMPMYYAYASVPVGSLLMTVRLVERMINIFKKKEVI